MSTSATTVCVRSSQELEVADSTDAFRDRLLFFSALPVFSCLRFAAFSSELKTTALVSALALTFLSFLSFLLSSSESEGCTTACGSSSTLTGVVERCCQIMLFNSSSSVILPPLLCFRCCHYSLVAGGQVLFQRRPPLLAAGLRCTGPS